MPVRFTQFLNMTIYGTKIVWQHMQAVAGSCKFTRQSCSRRIFENRSRFDRILTIRLVFFGLLCTPTVFFRNVFLRKPDLINYKQ